MKERDAILPIFINLLPLTNLIAIATPGTMHMASRTRKSAPKHDVPEDEIQESPEEEPAAVIESLPKGAVSQSDAARAALDAGYEKPAEAVAYIKTTFGIDMNPQYFSSVKMRAKASSPKKSEPAKRGRKPKAATPVKAPAAPALKAAPSSEPDLIESLETLKPLIAAMGAERVKRMVDLLG